MVSSEELQRALLPAVGVFVGVCALAALLLALTWRARFSPLMMRRRPENSISRENSFNRAIDILIAMERDTVSKFYSADHDVPRTRRTFRNYQRLSSGSWEGAVDV